MLDITQYEPEIKRLCQFFAVRNLYLVGSGARNDFTENSDIDILIEFEEDENRFDRYFTLKEKLEELFGRKIDLIEAEAVNNPYVKKNLQKDRVLVYPDGAELAERNPGLSPISLSGRDHGATSTSYKPAKFRSPISGRINYNKASQS